MPPKKNQKYSQHKNRQFSSPEEIQEQLSKLDVEDEEEETSSEEEDTSSSGDSSSGDEDHPKKGKGVQDLITIENPNRNPKKVADNETVQLSRREREEIEKQRAKKRYDEMHAAGKTDQAKADLARLAEIRKRRAEEAAKRAAAAPAPSAKASAKK